ncbi:MAG TPA: hypothetical protein VL068_10125, partial [Microthrixaceae bacterium]|nr:hypothetical protein [Microthrixaceae bacterium]
MNQTNGRRRAAAILALACVAALPCVVVLIMWHHRSSLVLGLLGLAIAAVGGWWGVAYHMPRRFVGAIAAAVGLGLIAISLIDPLVDSEQVLIRITVIATVSVVA